MDNSLWRGKVLERGSWGRQAGPAIVIQVEGVGEPTRLTHITDLQCGTGWFAFQQVPVTLEDMAAYLSQEEWESPDPAQRDCSWDALPEHRGNVRRGPGHCSSVACLMWAGLRKGGFFPRLAVPGWVPWARATPWRVCSASSWVQPAKPGLLVTRQGPSRSGETMAAHLAPGKCPQRSWIPCSFVPSPTWLVQFYFRLCPAHSPVGRAAPGKALTIHSLS